MEEKQLIKREWLRCKGCEFREVMMMENGKSGSYCTFWDYRLKLITWCNKDLSLAEEQKRPKENHSEKG